MKRIERSGESAHRQTPVRAVLLAIYRVRVPVYGMAALVLVVVALTSGLALWDGSGRMRAVVAFIAMGVLVACMLLVLVGPRLVPERETSVVASPVHGRWLGMNSPATKVPSHGVRMYGQAYAIDLVHEPIDAERPSFGSGPAMREASDYPAFGQPVVAMIDGTVVRATDRQRDHRARSSGLSLAYMMLEGVVRELGGTAFILGNHVTIRGAAGEYATVAHLQQDSVMVQVGARVHAGEQIARCGNSGNSSEPHVHAQLMDRASPWTAQGLPLAFDAISLDDAPERMATLPATGQHMTALPADSPSA